VGVVEVGGGTESNGVVSTISNISGNSPGVLSRGRGPNEKNGKYQLVRWRVGQGKKKLFPGRLGDNHLLLGIVNGSNGLEGGSRSVHEFNGDGASSISASGGPVDDNIINLPLNFLVADEILVFFSFFYCFLEIHTK
jgi:hypothetical protein